MAIVQNDVVLRGLSGKIGGELVLHQQRNGQYAIRTRHVDAHQLGYAKSPDRYHLRLHEALLCPPTASCVPNTDTTESRHGSIREAIQVDVIHPPEIHSIDVSAYTGQAGETISIEASDDNKVASLGVLIMTSDGTLIENGAATISDQNPYIWKYTTTATASSQFTKILLDVADLVPRDERRPREFTKDCG